MGLILSSPRAASVASSSGLGISFVKATVALNPRTLLGDIKDVDKAEIAMQFRAVADPNDAAAFSGDVVGRYILHEHKSHQRITLYSQHPRLARGLLQPPGLLTHSVRPGS